MERSQKDKARGYGQDHPWRQPRAPPVGPTSTAHRQPRNGRRDADLTDNTGYTARIKNLEAIRRSARKSGEHAVADQLTAQITELRQEKANARPIHE